MNSQHRNNAADLLKGSAVILMIQVPAYYHHSASFFAWVLAFLFVWIGLHLKLDRVCGQMLLVRWWRWMGRHVTVVYVFQWLIIGNVATALYKTQSLQQCLGWFLAVLGTASMLTLVFERLREQVPPKSSRDYQDVNSLCS
jgi:hypothetical protein